MVKTTTTWISDEEFNAEHEGNIIRVDGNKKNGHGPKALLLTALAACSGIDVVSILKKKRVEFSDLSIEAETEQTGENPKVFKDIMVNYRIRIAAEDEEKFRKAIELSLDKYCGVSAMLKKNSPINYKIELLK